MIHKAIYSIRKRKDFAWGYIYRRDCAWGCAKFLPFDRKDFAYPYAESLQYTWESWLV
jgi:hypothetical protein